MKRRDFLKLTTSIPSLATAGCVSTGSKSSTDSFTNVSRSGVVDGVVSDLSSLDSVTFTVERNVTTENAITFIITLSPYNPALSSHILGKSTVSVASTPLDVTVDTSVPEREHIRVGETYTIAVHHLEKSEESIKHVCESDPFQITDELTMDPNSDGFGIRRQRFARHVHEGEYSVSYLWPASGNLWVLPEFTITKRDYGRGKQSDAGYLKSFNRAIDNPTIDRLGSALLQSFTHDNISEGDWVTDHTNEQYLFKRPLSTLPESDQFRATVKFVQYIDYRTDQRALDKYEYLKTVEETIVDGFGDCEDTAILLGSLLRNPPFEYDAILLFPRDHVSVGVNRNDIPIDLVNSDRLDDLDIVTVGDAEYVPVEPTKPTPIGVNLNDKPIRAVYDGESLKDLDGEELAKSAINHTLDYLTWSVS